MISQPAARTSAHCCLPTPFGAFPKTPPDLSAACTSAGSDHLASDATAPRWTSSDTEANATSTSASSAPSPCS